MIHKRLLVLAALVFSQTVLAGGDAAERKFISKGMSEAQVIRKIGKPDEKITGGKKGVKQWVYFPASGDSQTMTTIEIAKGKVVRVEREISR